MKLKILAIVVLSVIGIGAAFVAVGGLPASAKTSTRYLTGAATTGDVTDDVAATGTVTASASYGVSFGTAAHLATATATPGGSTAWTVKDLKVKVGDTVRKGEILATADTTELQRQLADATSILASAKVQLAIATTAVSDASSTAATRQANVSRYDAQIQVSNAKKARLDLIQQIQLATLKAPIDGLVTSVSIVRDLDAPAGDAIVIEAASFQVTANVVESDLAAMAVGQAATVSIGAIGAIVPGKVAAIAPTAAGDTTGAVVSYAVTVSLDRPPATVRTGMTADVTITIDSATNVLTVPATSLRGTAGSYSVLVLGADGAPTTQPVDVGLVTNTTAEIKRGLAVGQEVVTGIDATQTGTTTTGGFGGGLGGGGLGGGIPGGTRPRNGN